MLRCLLLAFTCGALHGAAIRGTVVEKQSGKPLARALVVVRPLAGSNGATASVRTNPNGNFEFPALPAGSYLVTASKTGFAERRIRTEAPVLGRNAGGAGGIR